MQIVKQKTCEIYEMWSVRLKSFSTFPLSRFPAHSPAASVCMQKFTPNRLCAVAIWLFYVEMENIALFILPCVSCWFFLFFFVCLFMNFISNQQSDEQTNPRIEGGPTMDVFAYDKKCFLCGQKVKNATFRRTFSHHHSLFAPIANHYPSLFSWPRATQHVRMIK